MDCFNFSPIKWFNISHQKLCIKVAHRLVRLARLANGASSVVDGITGPDYRMLRQGCANVCPFWAIIVGLEVALTNLLSLE